MHKISAQIHHARVEDQELMDRVLDVYYNQARYLKSAEFLTTDDPSIGGIFRARCSFIIPVSCYINSTGHFNSVEFNICYNQMVYYSIAKIIKHRWVAAFNDWQLKDFFRRQLPDILIVNFMSRFRRPINPRYFNGEIDITKIRIKNILTPCIYIKTLCRFFDDKNGYSEGEVDLAIKNLKYRQHELAKNICT